MSPLTSVDPGPVTAESAADRPRRGPKGERTRRRILLAARKEFGRYGYERATIRGIALAAEVDKSSVIQYFGTKQNLFRESVYWHIPIDELSDPDPVRSAENYLHGMLRSWAADPDSPMAVLLRASMTSEEAAELTREHLTTEAVDRIAAQLDGPDARLRASVFASVLMGIAVQRYLLRMPDLAEVPLEDVERVAMPLLRGLVAPDR
ncbi:TetR family transcriptional regulator [Kitasatospora sp. NPDC056531]|uniref:TetR/AcrR family transcriptional regulator n=1 Tax=Kitasatospora sp. NPDC056531 TaxID=3345856 RepID=UPI0036AEA8F8